MIYCAVYLQERAGWFVVVHAGDLVSRCVAGPFRTQDEEEALIDA